MIPFRASFRGGGWSLPEPLALGHPLDVLEVPADRPEELAALLARLDALATSGDPRLVAAGFLSYEAGVYLEGSTPLFRAPVRTPLASFAVFSIEGGEAPGPDAEIAPRGGEAGTSLGPADWRLAIDDIREGIARGDVYQVNLTRRTTFPRAAGAGWLADALFADNPVPYACTFAGDGWAVVSNSPELLLDVDLATGTVASAPIKGTIARGDDAAGDERARAALLASEKDAAEHVMIVDLVRNDLGKVAEPGSVRVPRLRTLLTFRYLHHLESLVIGRLRPGVGLSDVLAATLPGGSITGAPKRASLGFIRRLEPVPRGPYTGAAGYVRGNGRAVFNVAIRTAILSEAGVDYHAGGGIVWDSLADREWQEAETKSRELQRVLQEAP